VTDPVERLAHGITRELLEADAIRQALARHHPEVETVSEAELRASLADTLARAPAGANTDDGVWLFAYGSLLWNPCVAVAERRHARLYGYHRDFRLRLDHGRGSPGCPGLMLGLVPGGCCRGKALRIGGDDRDHELLLVWRRELITGVYRPQWIRLRTDDGGHLDVIAFVVDSGHPCHTGRLDDATTIELLATGAGMIGRCSDYLEQTVAYLDAAGIHDRRLHRLRARVRARLRGAA
jgi:cation transport protein ChaC